MSEFSPRQRLVAGALVACLGVVGCSREQGNNNAPPPSSTRSSSAPTPAGVACRALEVATQWIRTDQSPLEAEGRALAAKSLGISVDRINAGKLGPAICDSPAQAEQIVTITDVLGTASTCVVTGWPVLPSGANNLRNVIAACPAP